MRIAKATLESLSPYSQRRFYEVPKLNKEAYDAYEKRTWRESIHADENGDVYIPPMSLKKALDAACAFKPIKIPGHGQSTYTKHFVAGIMCTDLIYIGIKKDDVEGICRFVPSDGKKGGGKRVKKFFPTINNWTGTAVFYVLDDTIPNEIVEEYLHEAGSFVGIGVFRPSSGGYFGRFKVLKVEWATA